jgi:hypothetical protein
MVSPAFTSIVARRTARPVMAKTEPERMPHRAPLANQRRGAPSSVRSGRPSRNTPVTPSRIPSQAARGRFSRKMMRPRRAAWMASVLE